MSEIRRGAVVLIQRGDPQIAGAIAEGMLAARATAAAGTSSAPFGGTFPRGEGSGTKQLPPEQIEVVKAEIDRQHIARLVRVAVGNDYTAEDYQCMIIKARHDYGKYYRQPGPLRRIGDALLGVYALLVCGVRRAYRAQDRLLGSRD